jgi:hypothetical protein
VIFLPFFRKIVSADMPPAMAEATHRTAKDRRQGAAKNRITLFYQEGLAATGPPSILMPNLAIAGESRRPGSGSSQRFGPKEEMLGQLKKNGGPIGPPENSLIVLGLFAESVRPDVLSIKAWPG